MQDELKEKIAKKTKSAKSILTNIPERMREREKKKKRKKGFCICANECECVQACVWWGVRESERVRERESPTDFAESFKGRKSDIR